RYDQPAMTPAEKQELIELALKHQQAGRFAEAAGAYRYLLAREPDDPHLLSALGILARQSGRNDLAIGYAGRAVQIKPESAVYQHNYGEAWLVLGEVEQAILAFARAIALEPKRPEPHAGLGVALQQRGRWNESAQVIRKAIELGLKSSASLHVDLAKALMRLEKLDEADEALKQAESLQPDLPELWQVRGEIL